MKRPSMNNQRGMVSIIVTMVMMLVISIIVLGFAQVSRREARQSLDRQLSQQAFFAAESGVNDARSVIYDNLAKGKGVVEKNYCQTDPSDTNYKFNPTIDSEHDVAYTCLLVTSKLKNLHITPLSAGGDSVVLPLQPTTATPIDTLHINWRPLSGPQTAAQLTKCVTASLPAAGAFPQSGASTWQCPYGTLRVDIVPTDTLSRAALQSSQKTFILYPSTGAAGKQTYSSSDGAIALMKCTVADSCNIDIQTMNGGQNYAIRVSAMYASGSVDLSATDAAGQDILLKNAQVLIDVTGRAQDVLRRIQVRLPVTPSGKTPDYAVESASSVCKRFVLNDTYFQIPGDIAGQDPNNPLCKAATN